MNYTEAANRRKPHFTEVFPNVDPFTVMNLLETAEIADILFAKYQPPFVKGTSDNSNSQLVTEAKASLEKKGWSGEAIEAAVQISMFSVERPTRDPSLQIEWLKREPQFSILLKWMSDLNSAKDDTFRQFYTDLAWLAITQLKIEGWSEEQIQAALKDIGHSEEPTSQSSSASLY